ncbi:sphingomyelin phosphodiesterase [Streptomyces sp. NPDC057654]|uniref:sphingomyelin phosphodiesterase n=1 Tax=Streptomyces sp. NPDC057654 TaxID=3346196 RepID=UPI0036CEFA38
MRILTHNVMLLTYYEVAPKTHWDQDERAAFIGQADYLDGYDIIALQEMFDNGASDKLLTKLVEKGYPYSTPVVGRSTDGWDRTQGELTMTEDGGAIIVSKWPIEHKEQLIYEGHCGTDKLAGKGFAYAIINVDGLRTHMVCTHTQSDDEDCDPGVARTVRRSQIQEMNGFLQGLHIPANEPVIVAGDFNIDRHSTEFDDLLRDGNLQRPDQQLGWKYSFDTQENSVAKYRYPNDPRQDLDHVLLRTGHTKPGKRWNNKVLKNQSRYWENGQHGFTDYSDHYPLAAGDVE